MSHRKIILASPWVKTGCTLGESPIYDAHSRILHFVDIVERKVYHLNTLDTTDVQVENFDIPVTALALRAASGPGRKLACIVADGFALLEENSTLTYLVKPLSETQAKRTRFNDGALDSKGRWFAGTIYSKEHQLPGQLWKYDPTNDTAVVVDEGPFTDSNGLGWSPDGKTLYFTDSLVNVIYSYDYDYDQGSISNRRVFVDCMALGLQPNSFPDGLCIDNLGGVWSARWGGSRVVRFTPEGTIDCEIVLPSALNITACCFGGVSNSHMYITTAHCSAMGGDSSRQELYPQSGDLFMVDLTDLYDGGNWRFEWAATTK